jgi:hypothetical protein
MSQTHKNRIFEVLFWASIAVGFVLIIGVFTLGWLMYKYPPNEHVDVGVVLATGALALFTAFLWFAAAITARFARSEILTSTAVNSANLTLQLDNRFNSDRALRIRHGAVKFLAEKRKLHIDDCGPDISPYATEKNNLWYDLSSDLIDLFNYFDWIGYLTSEESRAIDREVLRRKLGPWITNYYEMCEDEIRRIQRHQPDRWPHLGGFYQDLLDRQHKFYDRREKELRKKKSPLLSEQIDHDKDLDKFLLREHVRSHRGFHGPPMHTWLSMGNAVDEVDRRSASGHDDGEC